MEDYERLLKERPYWITHMLFALFSIMDRPTSKLSFEEARSIAEKKETVKYLKENLPQLTTWEALSGELEEAINKYVYSVALGLWGDEWKKTLVKYNGYSLLGGFLN